MNTTSQTPPAESDRPETVSPGNNPVVSVVLFAVIFVAFCLGLYIMSLLTPVYFIAGLAIVLLSLFATFTLVPKLLT